MILGKDFSQLRISTRGADIHLQHGGSGLPLLLLHGYPQTHAIWHNIAPRLAQRYHVICPDLRGYGDSSKPASSADHAPYSKRAMAADLVEMMAALGYRHFAVAGHDRGARVAHRMALDYPDHVQRVCMLDIVPTRHVLENVDLSLATGYYHWFFLTQPDGLPEHLIGSDPDYFLDEALRRWSAPGFRFNEEALAEYRRCFRQPETIHASCEDYRAGANIDLAHDLEDQHKRLCCPLMVLWSGRGLVGRLYDVLDVWSGYAEQVQGKALDCGHFLPEEAPDETFGEMVRFFDTCTRPGEQQI